MELLQGTYQIGHTLHIVMVTTLMQPGCVSLEDVLILEMC